MEYVSGRCISNLLRNPFCGPLHGEVRHIYIVQYASAFYGAWVRYMVGVAWVEHVTTSKCLALPHSHIKDKFASLLKYMYMDVPTDPVSLH